jgi:uncharacterized damage-inducible protein DinB
LLTECKNGLCSPPEKDFPSDRRIYFNTRRRGTTIKTLRKMFEHMHWADSRILELLQQPNADSTKAAALFAHSLQAELIWLTRLQGEDSASIQLWPEAGTVSPVELSERNREGYAAYFAGLSETDLDAEIRYRNQSGQEFQTSIRNMLTHVALHGQYHRGQINALIRGDGGEPVNVDFITYIRLESDGR